MNRSVQEVEQARDRHHESRLRNGRRRLEGRHLPLGSERGRPILERPPRRRKWPRPRRPDTRVATPKPLPTPTPSPTPRPVVATPTLFRRPRPSCETPFYMTLPGMTGIGAAILVVGGLAASYAQKKAARLLRARSWNDRRAHRHGRAQDRRDGHCRYADHRRLRAGADRDRHPLLRSHAHALRPAFAGGPHRPRPRRHRGGPSSHRRGCRHRPRPGICPRPRREARHPPLRLGLSPHG